MNKITLKIISVIGSVLMLTIITSSAFALSGSGYTVGDFYYENWSNGLSCTSYWVGDFYYTNC